MDNYTCLTHFKKMANSLFFSLLLAHLAGFYSTNLTSEISNLYHFEDIPKLHPHRQWFPTEKNVLSRKQSPWDFPRDTSDQNDSLRLGSIAPNFQAETTNGPIDFHEYVDHLAASRSSL